MPYPGVTDPATIKKIDDCVDSVMANPKVKPRKGQDKKSSAIAICRSSIKGEKMEVEQFTYQPSEKEEFAKGTLIKNVEIFKEGLFKGKKWTKEKLQEIVDNFKRLKDTASFDPPVRLGHRSETDSVANVKNIVGYIEDVRLGQNKKKEAVVLADWDVIDKNFVEDVKSGKYRKKSVELGPYEDNKGNKYGTVLWGTGIVDAPAVENMPDLAINVYSQAMPEVLTKEKAFELAKDLLAEGNEILLAQKSDIGKIKKAITAIISLLESAKTNEDWFDVSRLAEILSSLKSRASMTEQNPMNKETQMDTKKDDKKEDEDKTDSSENTQDDSTDDSDKGQDDTTDKSGEEEPANEVYEGGEIEEHAKLTRKAINDLPDSTFAYIESGGKKDAGGNTEPRSLRHYPVHDAAHARNAAARAAQGKAFASEARPKICAAAKKFGVDSEWCKGKSQQDKDSKTVTLAKEEYDTLMAEKERVQSEHLDNKLQELIKAGKVSAGLLEQEKKFLLNLSESQREEYLAIKEASPAMIELDKSLGKQESKEPGKAEKGLVMSKEKKEAVDKAKENIRLYLQTQGWKADEIDSYFKERSM